MDHSIQSALQLILERCTLREERYPMSKSPFMQSSYFFVTFNLCATHIHHPKRLLTSLLLKQCKIFISSKWICLSLSQKWTIRRGYLLSITYVRENKATTISMGSKTHHFTHFSLFTLELWVVWVTCILAPKIQQSFTDFSLLDN